MTTSILRCGRRGKITTPFERDAALGKDRCSRPLQRRIVDFYAERSGRKTIAALHEHYGIEVSLHAVQTVSHKIAAKAKTLNSEPPVQQSPASETLTAQLDGSMVPVIEFQANNTSSGESADRRTRRQICWKELRLCTVTAQGRSTTRYGVARGSPFEVGCMMTDTCRHEGMHEDSQIHGVADGAPWIADQYERQFGTRHTFLLDYYHVCEYLATARQEIPGTAKEQKSWYLDHKQALKKGESGKVIDELKKRIEERELDSGSLVTCWNYLDKRREQLAYDKARANGLPIGSGEVESGHRHILQQRLKIPGAWWKLETADEMSHLRVLRANNRWNELWQNLAN